MGRKKRAFLWTKIVKKTRLLPFFILNDNFKKMHFRAINRDFWQIMIRFGKTGAVFVHFSKKSTAAELNFSRLVTIDSQTKG